MRCFSPLAIWLALTLPWAGPAIAEPEKLRVGMSDWPPAKIVEDGRFDGTDFVLLEELAKRAAIVFEYVQCPWRRCLLMLETGEIDLISSISRSRERERYLLFIEPPYRGGYDVAFYTRGADLRRYEDLRGLTIGYIRGSAYFERLDQDRSLSKFAVTREDQLLEMLARGRLDVVVGIGDNLDYLIQRRNLSKVIRRTALVIHTTGGTYIAMSRKSAGLPLAPKLGQALRAMTQAHRFETIEREFRAKLGGPKEDAR